VSSPLRSARLRRIIVAYAINRLGTWFSFVALSVAVFDHLHSAIAVAALLLCSQVLPAFVAPALIARVETMPRRGALSALYLFEGLVTTGLAILLWHFWLPAVLVLVALNGSAALAASSLLRAETARAARDYVTDAYQGEPPDEEVHAAERKANAAINVAFSGTFALGPVLAGVVVAAAGVSLALFVDAASFFVCSVMLLDLHPYIEEAGNISVRARLRAAWRHINDVPALRMLLLVEAIALVFFEFAGPIEIVYAKSTLHAGDGGYGLLLTSWGIGVIAGSVVFARALHRALGVMLTLGTLAIGLAYVAFAAAPSLAVAAGAALLGGIGNGVQWASVVSAVQRLTPNRLHGRLMGALESLSAVCPALGLTLGGSLVALTSARGAFLVAGLGASAAAAGFLSLSRGAFEHAVGTAGEERVQPDTLRSHLGESPRVESPASSRVD